MPPTLSPNWTHSVAIGFFGEKRSSRAHCGDMGAPKAPCLGLSLEAGGYREEGSGSHRQQAAGNRKQRLKPPRGSRVCRPTGRARPLAPLVSCLTLRAAPRLSLNHPQLTPGSASAYVDTGARPGAASRDGGIGVALTAEVLDFGLVALEHSDFGATAQ